MKRLPVSTSYYILIHHRFAEVNEEKLLITRRFNEGESVDVL